MKNQQIITSLLDNDLYTFTQMYFIWRNQPNTTVEYEFFCRNKSLKLGFLAKEVQKQVNLLKNLKFEKDELDYFAEKSYLTKSFTNFDFINNFLKNFRLFPEAEVKVSDENGFLKIKIAGNWSKTIIYEVPVLAIVNELYFKYKTLETMKDYCNVEKINFSQPTIILENNIRLAREHKDFKFVEFGTRRRYSKTWQDQVVFTLKESLQDNFIGTSNVFLAKKYNLQCKGTMAHQLISGYLSLCNGRIEEAQKTVLLQWLKEFDTEKGPELAIALSDTFTTKAFFKDFTKILAKSYNGTRQDSGNADEYADNLLKHYEKLGIVSKTKTLMFSNALDFPEAIRLHLKYHNKIKTLFGIGTKLTNDMGFTEAINIVIKLTKCNGKAVIKLSDDPTKAIGNKEMIEKVRKAYNV